MGGGGGQGISHSSHLRLASTILFLVIQLTNHIPLLGLYLEFLLQRLQGLDLGIPHTCTVQLYGLKTVTFFITSSYPARKTRCTSGNHTAHLRCSGLFSGIPMPAMSLFCCAAAEGGSENLTRPTVHGKVPQHHHTSEQLTLSETADVQTRRRNSIQVGASHLSAPAI